MKILTLLIALTIALVGCSPEDHSVEQSSSAVVVEAADTVYINGRIYTVNEAQPWAESVAIKDGKFIAVGSNDDLAVNIGETTEVIDLAGKFVMPGLVDTHTHPFISAYDILENLTLNPETGSLGDIQQQIKAYMKSKPDLIWVAGAAFPKGIFDKENPKREWLDEVSTEIPITIMDQGGHALWCNTIALQTAGMMDPNFEAPEYAIIERDENGVPSGTIRETALGVMRKFMPQASPETNIKGALFVQNLFNKNGVTAHRTATGRQEGLIALKHLVDENKITLHWAVSSDVNYMESIYSFEERMDQIDNRRAYASEFVTTDFVKIFVDGDLNGYGIRMMKPFEGTDDEYGKMSISPEELTRLVKKFDAQGISVQFHAIGSQSIEEVVLAMEAAAAENGGELNTRHYPDHMGFISIDQINRLVKLNRVIGFAPYFSFTFPGIHESYLQFVGKERLSRMQPMRTALDAGAIVGTGTDYSSLPQDPWPLLEGMTHRRNPWVGPEESEANNAAESISIEEAIRVYTMGGAYAMLAEDRIGSIEAGKYADFLVLDRNLLDIPIDDIDQTEVLMTVFSGRLVYAKESN
jgi:hypothetical protein